MTDMNLGLDSGMGGGLNSEMKRRWGRRGPKCGGGVEHDYKMLFIPWEENRRSGVWLYTKGRFVLVVAINVSLPVSYLVFVPKTKRRFGFLTVQMAVSNSSSKPTTGHMLTLRASSNRQKCRSTWRKPASSMLASVLTTAPLLYLLYFSTSWNMGGKLMWKLQHNM